MQNRQQIREQLGVLEEQLEELRSLARDRSQPARIEQIGSDLLVQDAFHSVQELSRLVHEQQLLKSVSAHDFLLRICTLLAQDAANLGMDVALSHYGEGKISMEMAEVVLASIVAGFRTSLKGHRAHSKVERVRQYLFPTASLYFEVKGTPNEIQFRLLDDGLDQGSSPDGGRSFNKLREHIARCGGWFGYKSFSAGGGMIEFKIPIAHNRTEALILRCGGFEALVPSSYVAETLSAAGSVPDGADVYRLDEFDGLSAGMGSSESGVRIGVADQQFWIGCDSIAGPVSVRKVSADPFVENDCWMRSLGLFPEGGHVRALPMLDGSALVKLRRDAGGTA